MYEDLLRAFEWVKRHPREQQWADRMKLKLERRGNPEIATAAFEPPEQICVVVFARLYAPTLGRDDVYGDKIVSGEPLGRREPSDPAAQRQSGDPRVADDATGGGQPEQLGFRIEITPGCATTGARAAESRLCMDVSHSR